jgi:alpha-beta hydrolase superfamily lysophospholipase
MTKDTFSFASATGQHTLHGVCWRPEGAPRAIVQISHGMIEYVERYEPFAQYLTEQGFLVAGHDHVGHGQSVAGPEQWGHFGVRDAGATLVEDVHALTVQLREQYPGVPLFLLGHSMGSFVARRYMMTYGAELSGALVIGTGNQPTWELLLGQGLAAVLTAFFGEDHRSRLMQQLLFGLSNRRIPHPRTASDWITKDEAIVDAYVQDPACSFRFTLNGYANLFGLIRYVKKPAHNAAIPKQLPIILLSGTDDPVGSYGKAVRQVYQNWKQQGIADVSCKLYPTDRHEILNETDRDVVYADIAAWLERHL